MRQENLPSGISSTRFKRFALVIEARFSAAVWSCASFGVLTLIPLPRLAGVTSTRYLLFGAKIPWKRVRLTLGLGIRETSLEIKPSGSNMTCVVALRQGVRLKRLLFASKPIAMTGALGIIYRAIPTCKELVERIVGEAEDIISKCLASLV